MSLNIHISIKTAAFIASVIFLSWSFAGYHAIRQAATGANFCIFFGAVFGTMLVLAVQGYWIYEEEKEKGTLKRKIALFDRIYLWLKRADEKQARRL
jgi:hypothetical protein